VRAIDHDRHVALYRQGCGQDTRGGGPAAAGALSLYPVNVLFSELRECSMPDPEFNPSDISIIP
jgi:hypothetical protein